MIKALTSCLCFGLCLLLVSCGSLGVSSDRLVLSQISDPSSFNTYLSTDQPSRTAIAYLQAGLTQLNEDTLQPEPQLAEKWEVLDDGLRYVFTLRDNLKWSDGEPITAEDVDFTFNDVIFNEKIPTSSRDVQRIGESGELPTVRLLNERQIEFTLPEPFAPFLIQAGSPLLPKHRFQGSVEQTDAEGNPLFLQEMGIQAPPSDLISAGPYVMTGYVPNQRITYAANPNYWEQDSQPLPKIPGLILGIVDSQDTQLLQFRSREIDVYTARGADFQLLKQEEERDQFTIFNTGPTTSNNFICFNQTQARDPATQEPLLDPIKGRWFRDVTFRRAVAHAINKQGLVDSVLQGLGEPQDYTISPASPFHLSPEEGAPVYEYNPDKARQLLQSAGYTYTANQRLEDPEGNEVRFTLNTNTGNQEREATGSLIKSDLDAIGITVDFVPIAFNTLVEKISATRNWDAVMLSVGGGGIEPNNSANIWRSTGRLHLWNLGSQPGNEVEGVVVTEWEQEIDQIFSEGTRILDFDQRKQLYDRFQVITQEQLPLINTYNPLVLTAIRDRVDGVDPRPVLGPLWNYQRLELRP